MLLKPLWNHKSTAWSCFKLIRFSRINSRLWLMFRSLVFQVEKVLALHELSSSTLHHTQGCSALDGQGLQPGLEKLYEMILKRKKMLRHSKKKRWGGGGTSQQLLWTLWTTACLWTFSCLGHFWTFSRWNQREAGMSSAKSRPGLWSLFLPPPLRHLGRAAPLPQAETNSSRRGYRGNLCNIRRTLTDALTPILKDILYKLSCKQNPAGRSWSWPECSSCSFQVSLLL